MWTLFFPSLQGHEIQGDHIRVMSEDVDFIQVSTRDQDYEAPYLISQSKPGWQRRLRERIGTFCRQRRRRFMPPTVQGWQIRSRKIITGVSRANGNFVLKGRYVKAHQPVLVKPGALMLCSYENGQRNKRILFEAAGLIFVPVEEAFGKRWASQLGPIVERKLKERERKEKTLEKQIDRLVALCVEKEEEHINIDDREVTLAGLRDDLMTAAVEYGEARVVRLVAEVIGRERLVRLADSTDVQRRLADVDSAERFAKLEL